MALLEQLRSLYLERGSGVVEVDTTALYLRDGELMLDRSEPHAIGLGDLLPGDGSFAGNRDEVRQRMVHLARDLAPRRGEAKASKIRGAVELVGPLPIVYVLLELAGHELDETVLLEGLGGALATYRSRGKSPALEQLRGLDPDMGQVLACLERPMPIRSLLKSVELERLPALRALSRLWAVGLADRPEAKSTRESSSGLLSTRGLEHFRRTIGEGLRATPLELEPEEHGRIIVDTWTRLGELDHYQLLELDPRADEQAVHTAYGQIARLVHPSHAEHLGMAGRDEILNVLFERVTEAYLVLSNAGRRLSYNQLLGLEAPVEEVTPEKRAAEKAEMAHSYYRRGVQRLGALDTSVAVDLLKEAVRLDPEPEYLAALGLAQAKNPAWRRHALGCYRRAVELAPKKVKFQLGLAAVLEKMERDDEAREQYRRVLELEPSNHVARDALERLSGETPPEGEAEGGEPAEPTADAEPATAETVAVAEEAETADSEIVIEIEDPGELTAEEAAATGKAPAG